MNYRIVKKSKLHNRKIISDDLSYWLSRSPEERIETVEFLRKQYYGKYPERLQRIITITKQK
ncbi:MAG: hypothetical protein J7K04_15390 [Spirochaetales bacterium]|nr:hypothetical protein [Spirochaetales bacterium]